METSVSKLAVLQALGTLGETERENYSRVIAVLQSNSDDVVREITGAKPGRFVFRGTPQPYRSSFTGIPVGEDVVYVQWPPEHTKGAPIANHPFRPIKTRLDKGGDWRMPNNDRIVRTRRLYIAVADDKGVPDFANLWMLALSSTAVGFYDREFASAYPMKIVVDGVETQGPMASCKWTFSTEPTANDRGQPWRKIKYVQGPTYGEVGGPTWDEVVRGAELEAEIRKASLVAKKQAAAAELAATTQIETTSRGKIEITSGPLTPLSNDKAMETGTGQREFAPIRSGTNGSSDARKSAPIVTSIGVIKPSPAPSAPPPTAYDGPGEFDDDIPI
jgi:hypothetical protein